MKIKKDKFYDRVVKSFRSYLFTLGAIIAITHYILKWGATIETTWIRIVFIIYTFIIFSIILGSIVKDLWGEWEKTIKKYKKHYQLSWSMLAYISFFLIFTVVSIVNFWGIVIAGVKT